MWIKTSTFCESISDGSSIWRNLIGGTHTHIRNTSKLHTRNTTKSQKRDRKRKKRGNWLFNLSIKYENITTRFTQSTKLKHVHLQIIYTIWMCVLYVPHRWAHNSVASATWNRITGLIYTIVDFYNFNWFSATKTESINKTTFSNALRQHTQTHWCGLLPILMRCSQLSYRIYVVAIQPTKFSKILSTAQLKTMIITCQKKCALYDNDYIWVGALKTCSQLHATNEHFN